MNLKSRYNLADYPSARRSPMPWVLCFLLALTSLANAQTPSAPSDEFDLVGSLALAAQPEGAEILRLDEAQIAKLRELINTRQTMGRKQLAESKLDTTEKAKLRENWIRDSEQLGNQLLTLEQRQELLQLLLAEQGMSTLGRPDVAQIIGLSADQSNQVAQILKQKESALADATPLRRRIAMQNSERRLQAILKPAQLARWETLAGLAQHPQAINRNVTLPIAAKANTTADDKLADEKPADEKSANENASRGGEPARSKTAAQTAKTNPRQPETPAIDQVKLRFAFEGESWRSVLDWLAEEADLSLYVGSLPTDSLTYADKREYTPDQAIERINRFLIPMGYTLIRSGKMISVIGLADTRRDQLLDALAEYCDLGDLDKRGDHEVVKCMFTIAKADPATLLTEVQSLVKLSRPILMPKSKQLIVIETASKLRMIREVIQAIENPSPDQGPIRKFTLKHVRANDILPSLRPLIGIDDESSLVGQDINISITPDGKQILATGSGERLAIIEAVLAMLDTTGEELSVENKPILKSHPVRRGNLQTIDDVLQTLLAGENVRLAQEPQSNRLIAMATPSVHERIAKTIAELESTKTAVFETIQLSEMEPFYALSVVREMLNIPFFVDEDDDTDYPRIDSDTASMRIFVRGTQEQVDEIKEIVEALERPADGAAGKGLYRTLPIHGERAQQLLEQAKRFWPNGDNLDVFPFDPQRPNNVIERVINDPSRRRPQPQNSPSRNPSGPAKSTSEKSTSGKSIPIREGNTSNARSSHGAQFVHAERRNESLDDKPTRDGNAEQIEPRQPQAGPPRIKAQVTPRGILLYSKDTELLDMFEQHVRNIAGPGVLSKTRMAIFYLTHISADSAKRMLVDLRRGGSQGGMDFDDEEESGGGRNRYRYVPPPSVISDARLNRLIVQGTADQIIKVEEHLQIIDRDRSIADIQIRGKPQIIQLYHIRADEAAQVIREAYAGQIQGAAAAPAANAKAKAPQPVQVQMGQIPGQAVAQQPAAAQRKPGADQNKGGDKEAKEKAAEKQGPKPPAPTGGGQGQQSRTQEPRIGLAIDRVNNALIVRAPDRLFKEVSELIRLIDTNATQTTTVLGYDGVLNATQLRNALEQAFGSGSKSRPAPSKPAPKPSPPQPAAVNPSFPQILQFGGQR